LRTILTVDTVVALPLYIGIAYLVKLMPAFIMKRYFPWRETLGAGVLLASRLSLNIAIALVAFEAGIISETTYSTFILVAIVTCVVSPVLFSKIFPAYKEKREATVIAGSNEIINALAGKIDKNEHLLILADTGPKICNMFDAKHDEYEYWEHFNSEKISSLKDVTVKTFVAAYDEDADNQKPAWKR
jgi:hypothetical protein